MAKYNKTKRGKVGFQRLTIEDRCLLETRYCRDFKKMKDIAQEMGRPLSTITREIQGKPRKGISKYSARAAQDRALNHYKKQGRRKKGSYAIPVEE